MKPWAGLNFSLDFWRNKQYVIAFSVAIGEAVQSTTTKSAKVKGQWRKIPFLMRSYNNQSRVPARTPIQLLSDRMIARCCETDVGEMKSEREVNENH